MVDAAVVVARRQTARLVLRRPEFADLGWLTELHADPANYEHMPGDLHSRGRAREVAEGFQSAWVRDGIGYWLVELSAPPGEPIGCSGIAPTILAGRPCFNLYYRFVTAARGRGLAAEAGREALAVAAALDPGRPVIVRTRPANDPARRLAEALGMERRPELDTGDGLIVYAPPGF